MTNWRRVFHLPALTTSTSVTIGTALPAKTMTFSRAGTAFRTDGGTLVSVASGTPRVNADGLLAEPACTNLYAVPKDHEGTWDLGTGIAVTANNATAPDGTLTADLIVESSAGVGLATHRFLQNCTGTVASTPNTNSQWIKFITGGREWVSFRNASASKQAWFNIRYGYWGTIDAGVTVHGPISGPNGWMRIGATCAASGAADQMGMYFRTADAETAGYTGDGRNLAYVWYSQSENSSVMTSTTDGTARVADACTVSATGIIPPTMGSGNHYTKVRIKGEYRGRAASQSGVLVDIGGGTGGDADTNRLKVAMVTTTLRASVYGNGESTERFASIAATHSNWNSFDLIIPLADLSTATFTVNGTAATLDATMTGSKTLSLPSATIAIGSDYASANQAAAWLREVEIFVGND